MAAHKANSADFGCVLGAHTGESFALLQRFGKQSDYGLLSRDSLTTHRSVFWGIAEWRHSEKKLRGRFDVSFSVPAMTVDVFAIGAEGPLVTVKSRGGYPLLIQFSLCGVRVVALSRRAP
jgi:hypothetical protein